MRNIPSIEQLRQRPAMRRLEAAYGRGPLVEALRAEADALRQRWAEGDRVPDTVVHLIEEKVPARLAALLGPSLRPVINATGVVLHTNLGRAPLCASAVARLAALSACSNLEYDLASGARGRRDTHAERLLCHLTGAAAAVVVNNNAAGTLLALAALAAGREVIISRGELVEIGGTFRIPDVMAQSGAALREVGTTNRTRPSDYAAAIGPRTAAILRVHPSNFRMHGFTERPALADLVMLARRFGVPLIEDIGSGWVGGASPACLGDEPRPAASISAGADVVLFSGDKLLGGPQAGIVAGGDAWLATIRRHPLMRALRVDKLTYAALEATLQEHAAGRAAETIPAVRMLSLTMEEIGHRAAHLAAGLAGNLTAAVLEGTSVVGGGSVPAAALPTRLLALTHAALDATALEARLRSLTPPVIARIENGRVVLDLRTVAPEEDALLLRVLNEGLDA